MNALKQRVEEARQRWNADDHAGYLTLYDESIRLHGYAPEPMTKAVVVAFYQQIWASFGSPPALAFHETMADGDLYLLPFHDDGTAQRAVHGDAGDGPGGGAAGHHDDALLRRARHRALVERGFPRPDDADRRDTGAGVK
jgi:hypothetical protein